MAQNAEIQTAAPKNLATPQRTIKDWLSGDEFKNAVKAALPSHLTPERFVRVALTAMMRTPKLAQCTQASLFKALLDLSSLGIEPDGRRAHLIPYENRKTNTVEAQLIIDYKGLIELAKRSGEVKSWRAELVCEKDEFRWENGVVFHTVNWLAPRGKALAVYSHIRNMSDIDDYEIMTFDQVEGIRKRSRAGNNGPWVTDFEEMAKKTVMRRHSKRLTLSPEFLDAIEKDQDKIEEIAPVSYESFMPQRLSEVQATQPQPLDEPVAPSVEVLAQQPDPEAKITPKDLKFVMDAMEKNKNVTNDAIMAQIKAQFKVDKLVDLKNRELDELLIWIEEYIAPQVEVGRQPGEEG